MHKDPGLAVTDGASHMLGGEGGRERQIAAGERLAQTHDVRADAGPVTGEQLAGATETGGDLVGDEQHPELVAQGAHPLQVARVVEAHAAGPLDDGLQHDGGDLLVMIRHQGGQLHHAIFIPLCVEAAARRLHKQLLGQEPLVELVHAAVGVGDAHGAEGIPVITAAQAEEAGSGGALGVPVLLGHLERHLHRHRAGIGEEHPIQPGRGDLHQLAAQLDGGGMGQAAKHHVGHLAELSARRRIQLRHLIAVNTGPPGAHAIHQSTAIAQAEGHALGAGHLVAGQGMGEGGIGVPDVVQVEFLIGHYLFCCQCD